MRGWRHCPLRASKYNFKSSVQKKKAWRTSHNVLGEPLITIFYPMFRKIKSEAMTALSQANTIWDILFRKSKVWGPGRLVPLEPLNTIFYPLFRKRKVWGAGGSVPESLWIQLWSSVQIKKARKASHSNCPRRASEYNFGSSVQKRKPEGLASLTRKSLWIWIQFFILCSEKEKAEGLEALSPESLYSSNNLALSLHHTLLAIRQAFLILLVNLC